MASNRNIDTRLVLDRNWKFIKQNMTEGEINQCLDHLISTSNVLVEDATRIRNKRGDAGIEDFLNNLRQAGDDAIAEFLIALEKIKNNHVLRVLNKTWEQLEKEQEQHQRSADSKQVNDYDKKDEMRNMIREELTNMKKELRKEIKEDVAEEIRKVQKHEQGRNIKIGEKEQLEEEIKQLKAKVACLEQDKLELNKKYMKVEQERSDLKIKLQKLQGNEKMRMQLLENEKVLLKKIASLQKERTQLEQKLKGIENLIQENNNKKAKWQYPKQNIQGKRN